ncbi:MAG TPA: cytochrome P460 family protein [Bryobacteraceae bacterium]|nr:cytochrome P460 family protein [Bryobacteraceae bacterium]
MRNAALLTLAALALSAQTAADGPRFNAAGQLQLPQNYREWIYLSSGLGMTYGPAASADTQNPAFDNVFVNPSSYRAFIETGHWPDKTMFVLEVRNAAEHGSINNGGHFQTEVRAIEAEVKDEKRFPRKWAWFGFGKGETATMNPATSSCNQCHETNAAVETTFVQFYPTLLEVAKQKGTLNSAYLQKSAETLPAGH